MSKSARSAGLATAAAVVSVFLCHTSSAHAEAPKPAAEGDVSVRAALVRSLAGSDLRAAPAPGAVDTSAPVVATRAGVVAPMGASRLTEIRGSSTAATDAGAARDVAVAAGTAAKTSRPVAGIRVQRRMNVERALGELASQTKACSEQAAVRGAATASFQVSVLPTGEVESAVPASTGGAPKEAVACAATALAKIRFGAPGAAGASLIVPVAFVPVKAAQVAKAPEAPVAPVAPTAPPAPEPVAVAAATPAE